MIHGSNDEFTRLHVFVFSILRVFVFSCIIARLRVLFIYLLCYGVIV